MYKRQGFSCGFSRVTYIGLLVIADDDIEGGAAQHRADAGHNGNHDTVVPFLLR